MGLRDRIRERFSRIRVVPNQTNQDLTSYTNDKDTVINRVEDAVENGQRINTEELFNLTQNITGDRNKRYDIYEQMAQDGRIAAALEIYANDAVQYSSDGRTLWVESDNSDIAKYCNKLLSDLNITDSLWSIAYCLCLYGDVYLETFQNTSNDNSKPTLLLEPLEKNSDIRTQYNINGSKIERYVEKVPNAADVYDLQYKGKTAGYVKSDQPLESNKNALTGVYTYNTGNNKINILQPTKYIHFCLAPSIDRYPAKLELIIDSEKNKDKEYRNGLIDGSDIESSTNSKYTYTIKTGQSILESAYSAWQKLKLKEDSVTLERLTKSSITRIIQVELGDMPESQREKKLRSIKEQIEQNLTLNKETGDIGSSPRLSTY